jgi:hypothetical protein
LLYGFNSSSHEGYNNYQKSERDGKAFYDGKN